MNKPRFPIGLWFDDYTKKHHKEKVIVDILTTTNSEGKIARIEYVVEHTFMGQQIRETVGDSRIARSLPQHELNKYLEK